MSKQFVVSIEGSLTVPVATGMLEVMEDPSLIEEIANEAVRISTSDALGGFDEFALENVPKNGGDARAPSHRALVNFNALSACIDSVQKRNAQLDETLQATATAVELCIERVGTASADELRAMLTTLLQTVKVAIDEECVSDEPPPPLTTGECEPSESDGSDSYEDERAAMGYQRLLGDDSASEEEP